MTVLAPPEVAGIVRNMACGIARMRRPRWLGYWRRSSCPRGSRCPLWV